ncbi:filamentous hemagglutinin outer membrane protein [Tolypothrix sp. NIES-4075]|uniref:two-partner secretion domain-containing protein n=1 Tax=Tolypothrix sp. NIES-4075 TaxID=2005459 RepID=UPI000B5C4B16|nr:filamentous hemagglutinin N-terminal domain-containing protein [Tolypothrix sp. NIES-4075]GAX39977.1 filamentous hemagglutinin outer membrane protein [Tolypothrix sp. NIES-4075]
MTKSWQHLGIAVILAVGGAIATATSVLAQSITIDGTLSPAQTLTGPVYTIPQSVGQTVGSNLFHSFGRFNLNVGERANFGSASDIRNIFSRVTGGSRSLIDGLIFTNSANVNLFLINPSGIVFGPNARLDVGGSTRGSFVATTVDALVWSNGSQFSATNPGGASSLLTIVGDPSGFLSTLRTPPPIDVNRSTLRVYEGQSLLLLGGNVNLDGSNLSVDFTEGGRIELGAVAEPGNVGLNTNGNILSFNFPENLARGDVSLTNGASLDATAGNGGSIAINARNIDILSGSQLLAGIGSGSGTVDSQAGDVTLNATDAIRIQGQNSLVQNNVSNNATGNSGNISITSGLLSLQDGAQLSASTFGQGNAGSINIFARDTVSLDDGTGDSFIFNNVLADAVGKSGGINITTGSLVVINGAQIQSRVLGQGNSGKVSISARDTVTLDGRDSSDFPSAILSRVETDKQSDSGGIDITTGSLFIKNGGLLSTTTFGQGNAGRIEIKASETVSLSGQGRSTIENDVASEGVGDSGGIRITTGSLFLSDLALITSNVNGRGNSGGVEIVARDLVSLDNSGEIARGGEAGTLILSRVNDSAEGNGGDINIQTASLRLSNSQITTSTASKGNAGNVIIEAKNQVALLRSSNIFTEVTCACETESGKGGDGNGGDIKITTGSLLLDGGSNLRADTEARGNAGNITINARDSVTFFGSSDEFTSGAFSQVEPEAVGKGGDIFINTRTLSLSGNQEINTRTQGQGNAGNIFIQADSISLTGSDVRIISNASQDERLPGTFGNGGDININNTGFLLVADGAKISANSEFSRATAGNIKINASQITLQNEGSIRSESVADSDGGNINLKLSEFLLLRGGGQISTNAGTALAGGNGGNINIDAGFIVALPQENSDISANAFSGNGGTVTINAQGIIGTESRQQPTPQSDITASSTGGGINGVVDINTPEIDPSREFIKLPTDVVNTRGLVAPSCSAFGEKGSEFIVTGRGGLPLSPDDFLSSDVVWSDTRFTALLASPTSRVTPSVRKTAEGVAIIPATGWVFNEKTGEVTLIAANASEDVGSNQVNCIVP